MFKINLALILIVLLLFMGNFVYAEEDLDSLRVALNNNSGMQYFRGSGKAELMGVSRDAFNIVRVVVITVLLVRAFRLYGDFIGAADNPSLKASIKTKAIWISAGLVFAINFWNILSFLSNIRIF